MWSSWVEFLSRFGHPACDEIDNQITARKTKGRFVRPFEYNPIIEIYIAQ